MSYQTRSARKMAKKSKYHFLTTIVITLVIIYASITWILPNFIGGLGFINQVLKPAPKVSPIDNNSIIAPPVLNIPFDATNSGRIDITGFGQPDSKINIYVDDQLASSATVSEDGSFTAQNVNLNYGTNNIYGKSVDSQNNLSLPSKTIQLTFSNSKPKLDISSPQDNQTTQDKKITVSGQTDPGDTVTINGNQIIVNSDGSFSSDQNLNDGDNTLTIRSSDQVGNYTEVTRKVTAKS